MLSKISFLAQRPMYPKFYVIFSQIYPTHSRSINESTETILAILYREVPDMLPAKYQTNWPSDSGKKSIEWVLTYMGMAAILNFGSLPF